MSCIKVLTKVVMLVCLITPAQAQVIPDREFDTSVKRPLVAEGTGPLVLVDTAHNNYHTPDNRYLPFAKLLQNDGFRVSASASLFATDSLKRAKILVIANAVAKDNGPTSPFTPEEVAAVAAWVKTGGALLLIGDHPPFAGAIHDMAAAFGFRTENQYVLRPPGHYFDVFTRDAGSLTDGAITNGRGPDERITTLTTFGGTAFTAPAGATPVIVMPEKFVLMGSSPQGPTSIPNNAAKGLLQAAVMTYDKGRVAVFGEAGMFSAQIIPGALMSTNKDFLMGFNSPDAPQNKQFILNLMHWLAGVL